MMLVSCFPYNNQMLSQSLFSQCKILAWCRLQEKNSLIISTEMSLQCSLSSVILQVKPWSSVDYHARCFFSLIKTLLGRSYWYPSCSIPCIASFIQVISPGMSCHSWYCKLLLAACTSLSYFFFPYQFIYPLLSSESW